MQNLSLILFFPSTFCPTLPHTKWALYENSFYASLKPGIIGFYSSQKLTATICLVKRILDPFQNDTNTNILPKYSIE